MTKTANGTGHFSIPKKKKLEQHHVTRMRRFELHRDEDESGVSGVGTVCEGVEFTNGMCAITWLTPTRCVGVYENIKNIEEVHGHQGKTRIVFLDE
jgi:hypothetical protein